MVQSDLHRRSSVLPLVRRYCGSPSGLRSKVGRPQSLVAPHDSPLVPTFPIRVGRHLGASETQGQGSQNTSCGLTGKLGGVSGCRANFTFFFLALIPRNLAGCFLFGAVGFMQLLLLFSESPQLPLGASHRGHNRVLYHVLRTAHKLSGASAPESPLRLSPDGSGALTADGPLLLTNDRENVANYRSWVFRRRRRTGRYGGPRRRGGINCNHRRRVGRRCRYCKSADRKHQHASHKG